MKFGIIFSPLTLMLTYLPEISLARGRFRQSSTAQVNHHCSGREIRLQLMNCPAAAHCPCQAPAPPATFELCASLSTATDLRVWSHLLGVK